MKRKNVPMTLAVFAVTVVCALLTTLTNTPPWPIFIGWSLFYLIGADKESVKVNIPSLVGGVALAFLTNYILSYFAPGLIISSILFGLMAASAIWFKDTTFFRMVSMVFVGINMFFALGSVVYAVILPILGFLMGLITNELIAKFEKSM